MWIIEAMRWLLAVPLAILWLDLASNNAYALVHRGPGMRWFIPFVGGLCGSLAVVLCPLAGTNAWAWLPALLDVGCIPFLLWIVLGVLIRKSAPMDAGGAGQSIQIVRIVGGIKSALSRLLRLAILALSVAVFITLLPIIIAAIAGSVIWSWIKTWRYRRGFESLFKPEGKQLVFVYSNSPKWKERIEQDVLPKIGDRAVVLNWSERSTEEWRNRPLEVRIFEHWGGPREFNPLAVVFPSEGPVEVIRFWQAYRDYKHGNPRLLRQREQELFEALGVPLEEQPEVRVR